MKLQKKYRNKRCYDLYKWRDWRDYQLKCIEYYRSRNKLDKIELEIHLKDGTVSYVGWYENDKEDKHK